MISISSGGPLLDACRMKDHADAKRSALCRGSLLLLLCRDPSMKSVYSHLSSLHSRRKESASCVFWLDQDHQVLGIRNWFGISRSISLLRMFRTLTLFQLCQKFCQEGNKEVEKLPIGCPTNRKWVVLPMITDSWVNSLLTDWSDHQVGS